MDNPEVIYDTPQQWLAIHGENTDIYPLLPGYSHAQLIRDNDDRGHRQKPCYFIYICEYVPPSAETYDQRPETIPFTRDDLEAFDKEGFHSVQGYWSVYWASDTRAGGDIIYDDGWRSVMSFRSIEFMIRPIPDFRNRADGIIEPPRLYIGWLDLKECLRQALERTGPMRTFTGVAYLDQPRRGQEDVIEGKRDIALEWRIDRAHPDRMTTLVDKWKHHTAFKDTEAYHRKVKEVEDYAVRETFNQELLARNPAATQPGSVFRAYVPEDQPEREAPRERKRRKCGPRKKRTSKDMGASQELIPSRKRRNVGPQSSRSSQSGSAPESLTSSPEMRRKTPVGGAEQQTTMPPPSNRPYTPLSVGSQSGRSSQSGFTSQSPAYSPETGHQTPTEGWPQGPRYSQRSVSSQSNRSSQSGQSFAYSPEVRRQTPVDTWQRTRMPPQQNLQYTQPSGVSQQPGPSFTYSPDMRRQTPVAASPQTNMPPPPGPRYAQPSYPDPSYGSSLPAASPRLGQPHARMPMQHVPAQGWQSAHGQPGGASTGHWGQTAPSYASYAPDTGYYPPVVPGAAPAMPQHQGTTPGTWGTGSYSPNPSFPSLSVAPQISSIAMAAPYSVVMAPQGTNMVRSQVPPSSSDPEWYQWAQRYMHSNQPQGGDQSGYQGQHGSGRGTGQH